MTERRYDEAYYSELIYRLLPALYRGRDERGELRKFLELFGHELARVRGNIDQLWRDFYIDSCQDWVIPYLAEPVGTEVVFNEAARNRADVKNTIGWRRRKGTLAGLEDVAAVISGWGALATEMFERLVWSQNLNHVRHDAVHALDLADGSRVARLNTAFDLSFRSVDIRPPDHRVGWHQVRNVNFFLWGIRSHPWTLADPAAVDVRRFRFHPAGLDTPLFAGGDKRMTCERGAANGPLPSDICLAHTDDVAIRGRDFRDHPLSYFGQPPGFGVYEDGILICSTADTGETRSSTPCTEFAELAASAGMSVADESLFGGGKAFRIEAVRLGARTVLVDGEPDPVAYSPTSGFADNFVVDGGQGRVDTDSFSYTKGSPFQAGAPDFHHPVLLLRIERTGAVPDFPESEIIVHSGGDRHLLVFLPETLGLGAGESIHLYVADDGSTYFARGTHDLGDVDRNPDAGLFGAYLPRHLARAAAGQVRPRPGARPVAHRVAVYRDLCCWDQPLQKPLGSGEVAFDPERGRFIFPAGEEPNGRLTVDFRFGLTGGVGAGPFARGELPARTLTVSQTADADHRTIQDAIDAAPDGGPQPVIIEILDSHTYDEALTMDNRDLPGGLTIQAQRLEVPVIRATAGSVLSVAPTTTASRLTLDGLVLAGGDVAVNGDVADLVVRHCSLIPGSVALQFDPAASSSRLELANFICGPVIASANVESVTLRDGILHHPDTTIEHPEGHVALSAAATARLDRVTVVGALTCGALQASNSILFGPFSVGAADDSCLRYSRYHKSSGPLPAFRSTTAFPVFVSIRYGRPGYGHLHPNTSVAVRKGGEEGGEMGAFYRAGIPWREQNVRIKLAEYIPAGLRPVPVRALPVPEFCGAIRI